MTTHAPATATKSGCSLRSSAWTMNAGSWTCWRARTRPRFERISAFQQIPALVDGDTTSGTATPSCCTWRITTPPPGAAARIGAMHLDIRLRQRDRQQLQPLRLTHVVSKPKHHLGVDRSAAGHAGHAAPTERVLRRMDQHLAAHDWLAGSDAPTVADIACYGYLALAEEPPSTSAPIRHRRVADAASALPSYVPPGMNARRPTQRQTKEETTWTPLGRGAHCPPTRNRTCSGSPSQRSSAPRWKPSTSPTAPPH